jgi:hypothetical protein
LTAKKRFLLRLEPELYRRLEKWAADELRSVNAQMEYLLRDSLLRAGRLGRETKRVEPPFGPDHDY